MKLKSVVLMLLLLSLCAVVTGCSGSAQNRAAVDVDISAMPAATAYSFASELFYGDSEAYRNCTVRVSGEYTQSYFDATGLYYDYVVVFDGTCCTTGVEFKAAPQTVLPEVGETIELVGTLDSYEELGQTYFYLKNASVSAAPNS